MPAAAVIPAPIAYIKVAAVKKLVVGLRGGAAGPPRGVPPAGAAPPPLAGAGLPRLGEPRPDGRRPRVPLAGCARDPPRLL